MFVDTNLFMYAVGAEHPLRAHARELFRDSMKTRRSLLTSAEVLQELMHAYIPVGRMETLDAALLLVRSSVTTVWPVEEEDVRLARLLADAHPGLSARDLLHVASCQRREVRTIRTFDRQLAAAFRQR